MKKKKLSTAMLAGWKKIKKQAFGDYFDAGGACAFGCVYYGVFGKRDFHKNKIDTLFANSYPELSGKSIKCLPLGDGGSLSRQVARCNDYKNMSVPAIAKGLKKCGL